MKFPLQAVVEQYHIVAAMVNSWRALSIGDPSGVQVRRRLRLYR